MTLKFETYYDCTGNQYMRYHRHGRAHRIHGPAILWEDGDMVWAQYNQAHRTDGPASLPMRRYYIRDVYYTEEEYYNDPKIRNYL